MIYFTSDFHLNETRIGLNDKPNLFFRTFSSIEEQNNTIINNFCQKFKDYDTLWHIGDVIIDTNYEILIELRNKFPNSIFNLIIGNIMTKIN